MKASLLKKSASLVLALALLASSVPGIFSTKASADYGVIGYNMVLYVTQTDADPHYRIFRSFSINKNFSAYGARRSYGEKHLTKYVTASQLCNARTYYFGDVVRTAYPGYVWCYDTAYYFGDSGGYVWFIESPVYGYGAYPRW